MSLYANHKFIMVWNELQMMRTFQPHFDCYVVKIELVVYKWLG